MVSTLKWYGPSAREKLIIGAITKGDTGATGAAGPAGPAGPTGAAGQGLLANHATVGRVAAATAGAGACYYDTTVKKPAWSDGTKWYDAAGVEIA